MLNTYPRCLTHALKRCMGAVPLRYLHICWHRFWQRRQWGIPRQGAMTRMRMTTIRMTMTRMTITRMTTTSTAMKLKRMSNLCPLHVPKLSECVDPVCTISLSGDAFEESATLAEASSRLFSCAMTSQALLYWRR